MSREGPRRRAPRVLINARRVVSAPVVVVVAKFGVHQKQLPEQRGARRFARVEQTETAAFAFGFFDQVSFSFEEYFRSPFYIRGENVGFAFDDVCQGEFGSD